ncbi:MAG: HAD family phosphatase [Planctomycetes bacterium]|nr:HAD family phosphatase [Planctomycetota bacterium]
MDQPQNNFKYAAIFDVDGTMVDNASYHQNAWIALDKRYDLAITPEYYLANIHSRSNDKNVRKLFPDAGSDEFINRISKEKESIYRSTFRPVLKEIPGLTNLIKELSRQNIPCAAASNSPKANVDMVLDELDIRKYFSVIIDRDQVTAGKPNPEILLTTAKQLAHPPQNCIVFEDSLSGFKAAQNAKMPYIVITAGAKKQELKHAKNPIATYHDFTKITPESIKNLLT